MEFYRTLYPMAEDPLFYIHLNIDYPFNLTGILYFPKIRNNFEIQKNKIQLYSNQVFVTDSVEGIVPEFLTLLREHLPEYSSTSLWEILAAMNTLPQHVRKPAQPLALHDPCGARHNASLRASVRQLCQRLDLAVRETALPTREFSKYLVA